MAGIRRRGQMSDAFVTVLFLTLSGGFQDAYTFLIRGHVFANAQTGNIVLMSARFFEGDWAGGLTYLVPLCAFALGVFAAQRLRRLAGSWQRLHWRQLVVLFEMVILGLVGFLPQSLNLPANALVSFSCAMQVQAFRKFNGRPYASTMCIGNLRGGTEALEAYLYTRDREALASAMHYFGVVALFAVGAGLGSVASPVWQERAVWVCCAALLASFLLMSLREAPAGAPPAKRNDSGNA